MRNKEATMVFMNIKYDLKLSWVRSQKSLCCKLKQTGITINERGKVLGSKKKL